MGKMYEANERIIFTKKVSRPFHRIFYVYGPRGFELTEEKKRLLDKFFNFLGKNLDPGITKIDVDISREGVSYKGHIGGIFEFFWEDLTRE